LILLLPPSEGKTPPSEGAPLGPLSHPALDRPRERVLNALIRLCAGREKRAREALGLSAGQAGEVARNAGLRDAPAAPAREVYTGVLYERLGLADLPADGVLIFSALWGVVRPDDRIPAYKLSMGAKLPRLPGLASFWRPFLTRALPDEGLVVDLRSGPYAAAWKPRSALTVRAFDPQGKVISHMVKATRGEVGRLVLQHAPQTPQDVAELVRAAGYSATLNGGALDITVAS
jgi:cytoplasmic iron level regulating protein YaaA (DUF328/UPF0246 family)